MNVKRARAYARRMLASWQLYALILPAFAYVFIFNYVPMYGVQIAFKEYRTAKGILASDWVGFRQIARILEYPALPRLIMNTLEISLYSLATFPLACMFALCINELDNKRFQRTVQMVSYAPHFISTVVICSMIQLFLNRGSGIINNLIEALGGARRDFLSEAGLFSTIFVWSGVWQGIGWGTIIYLAALSGVSLELLDAARIDGATRLQVVWHINIPCILPTIVTLLILRCGSVLSVGFEKVFLLQNSLNLEKSEVISTYVYNIGLLGGQFSYSSAISLFNNVVNVSVLLLVNALCKRIVEVSLW